MATVDALLTGGVARLRASGSESARLDAELLLAWAIGLDRTAVVAHPEAPVGLEAAERFEAALQRRCAGEPVAYIRGVKEFYGLAFGVDARALIPRPETELLVTAAEADAGWELTRAPRPAGTPKLRIVDVGTGCGPIVVALAVLLRKRGMIGEVSFLATDSSAAALELARENAVAHVVADTIEFAEADLLPDAALAQPFDLIVANLPYIPTDEVGRLPVAASFEPREALDGGPDGLTEVRRLLELLPAALGPDGVAMLEIGWNQGPAVEAAVADLEGEWRCWIDQDLSGQPRLARVARAEAGRLRRASR